MPRMEGYQEKAQNAVLRTDMEMGPAKQRRRFTAASLFIQCQYVFTQSQSVTFESFYHSDLKKGSLPFNWTRPRYNTACVARFTDPPQIIIVAGRYRIYSVNLEILP